MVAVNTYTRSIRVKQVIDVENSPYIVVTSCPYGEQITGCCLLHCRQGRIYSREDDCWSSIKDPYYSREIRQIILQAINDEGIPKFTTDLNGFKSILN